MISKMDVRICGERSELRLTLRIASLHFPNDPSAPRGSEAAALIALGHSPFV
jgi:hypothetical protein